MDEGPTEITEADVQARIRQQARTVYVRALISAVALTALALVIPGRG